MSQRGQVEPEPAVLGYAVIEADPAGNYPSYCVHGPDPVDTLDDARTQWAYLTKDARSGSRYFLCKLVPIDPEAQEER